MQLALFHAPPAERRRKPAPGRVGRTQASVRKDRVLPRRQRLDTSPIVSDPRLSFPKKEDGAAGQGRAPALHDERLDARQEPQLKDGAREDVELDVRGLERAVEFDTRAGEGDPIEVGAELAPHPTRGTLLPPEVLTEGEVRALIGACSKRGVTGHRNRALLAILWRTGVRISEALELRPHDVDFRNGTVRVRLGKGLKPRTTVLSDLDALPLVERWLEKRGKLQTVVEGTPLFCTLKGTPTDPSYARHLLPRLAKRAGLERRVHPHGLRHTHAADLAIAGVPVLAIQQQLGHTSLVTTANYLRRVGVRLDVAQMIRGTAKPPKRS